METKNPDLYYSPIPNHSRVLCGNIKKIEMAAMPFPCDGLMLCCVSLHWCFSINLLVVLSLISIYLFFIVDSLALALNSFKQIWFTHIWSQEVIYVITIALILWQLGYGLRTLNTLSQVTGYPNYRVSINMPKLKNSHQSSKHSSQWVMQFFKF